MTTHRGTELNALPVAIFEPLPAYRAGLALSLQRMGFVPDERVKDPEVWAKEEGPRAALVTIFISRDVRLPRLLKLANQDLIIVAICQNPSPLELEEAMRAGCNAVVDRTAHPDIPSMAVRAALHHHMVLPARTALQASDSVLGGADYRMSQEQIEWLRALAGGTTTSELAAQAGYSPREMYRKLAKVYQLLGNRDRMSALLTAARHGLL